MANFYIKRVTALGKGKRDSVIELSKGLNIIHGLSDTGKSCVLLCIDFIFGGDEPPFDETTGYSKVRILVETPRGEITLDRELGRRKIVVTSTDKLISPGKYDCKYDSRSNYDTISSLFLQLIGIEEEHQLIKNKDFVTDRLTWRTFSHTFLIDEESVYKKGAIMLPERKEANTLLMSSLIFLMKGQDFAGFDKREEKRIRDAKKGEIVKRINAEIIDLSKRKEGLEKRLEKYSDINLTEHVHSIIDEVSTLKERIEQANEKGKRLLGDIIKTRTELADCDLLLNRYGSLREHFIADIKRLTLIVDGEAAFEYAPLPSKCPICDNKIDDEGHPHYLEASQNELARLISELNGLDAAESNVVERRRKTENRLNKLNADKSDVDELIKEKLKPKEHELSVVLTHYKEAVRLRGELDFIQRFVHERQAELYEEENVEESKLEYLPREHFDSAFRETIDKYLVDIFEKCRFENFLTAHFDVKTRFDTSVNSANKATTRGKGYRAFINTVTALAFRKYLLDCGTYIPGLFFVDSPLLTLKQGVSDQAPASMKSALFRYLIEAQKEGQILVIENEIPELDYENYGVIPQEFTGGKKLGRYGFLYLDGQI